MQLCLRSLVPLWIQAGWGIELECSNGSKRTFTHLVWADNLYLLSRDVAVIKRMLQGLTVVLAAWGFQWKPGSLQYLVASGNATETFFVQAPGERPLQVEPVDQLELLGTMLSGNGSTQVAIEHRLRCASKAFWADAAYLRCREIPLRRRFERYVKRIQPCIVFASGAWAWCQGLVQRLEQGEGMFLRRIGMFRRLADEDSVAHWRRSC
eukprot:4209520-Lingulodinium_polyedra.AAC.1